MGIFNFRKIKKEVNSNAYVEKNSSNKDEILSAKMMKYNFFDYKIEGICEEDGILYLRCVYSNRQRYRMTFHNVSKTENLDLLIGNTINRLTVKTEIEANVYELTFCELASDKHAKIYASSLETCELTRENAYKL